MRFNKFELLLSILKKYLNLPIFYLIIILSQFIFLFIVNTSFINSLYFKKLGESKIPTTSFTYEPFKDEVPLDFFTECALLSIGIYNNNSSDKLSTFERAIYSPSLFRCEHLQSYITEGGINSTSTDYTKRPFTTGSNSMLEKGISYYGRFWHGIQVFSKPIIIIGGYRLLIKLNFLFFVFILALGLLQLRKMLNYLFFLPYLPFIIQFNADALFLTTYSVFYTLPILHILLVEKFKPQKKKLDLSNFLFGFIANFYSFLATPVLYILIPISVILLKSDESIISKYKQSVRYCCFMLMGYIFSIALKPILISLVNPSFGVKSVTGNQIEHYTDLNFLLSPFMWFSFLGEKLILMKNIRFDNFLFFTAIAVLAGIFITKRENYKIVLRCFPLVIPSLAWLLIMKNHIFHGFSSISLYGIVLFLIVLASYTLSKAMLLTISLLQKASNLYKKEKHN